ncbi:MAG: hypothetical protein AB7T38_16310 [Nitrospirales bacterium]
MGSVALLMGVCFLCLGPVWGENSTDTFSEISSPERQKTETDDSLLIGGGIHRPPDIGAAGTTSPTPPVRIESPIDEPDLLPSKAPVPSDPLKSRDASPSGEGEVELLGNPEFIKEHSTIPQ